MELAGYDEVVQECRDLLISIYTYMFVAQDVDKYLIASYKECVHSHMHAAIYSSALNVKK